MRPSRGSAGYVAGLAAKELRVPFPVAVLGGTLAAILIAVPIGYLSIRRRGIYFAMVTLAFAQMLFYVANAVRLPRGDRPERLWEHHRGRRPGPAWLRTTWSASAVANLQSSPSDAQRDPGDAASRRFLRGFVEVTSAGSVLGSAEARLLTP